MTAARSTVAEHMATEGTGRTPSALALERRHPDDRAMRREPAVKPADENCDGCDQQPHPPIHLTPRIARTERTYNYIITLFMSFSNNSTKTQDSVDDYLAGLSASARCARTELYTDAPITARPSPPANASGMSLNSPASSTIAKIPMV